MRGVGSSLVGAFALGWLHGGFEMIVTREDWALGEMALAVVLLVVGRVVLGRAHRGESDRTWKARFGAAMGLVALASGALALFASSTVRYATGRMIMTSILGGGAAVLALVAVLSLRASSEIVPPPDRE